MYSLEKKKYSNSEGGEVIPHSSNQKLYLGNDRHFEKYLSRCQKSEKKRLKELIL